MRRIAKVRVTFDVITEVLKGNFMNGNKKLKSTTCPDDLRIVSLSMDNDRLEPNWCWMIVESKSFKEIVEGEAIPDIRPFDYVVENVVDRECEKPWCKVESCPRCGSTVHIYVKDRDWFWECNNQQCSIDGAHIEIGSNIAVEYAIHHFKILISEGRWS